jgi:hypothetical protein
MKAESESIASVGGENRKGCRMERPGNLDLVMNGGSKCLLCCAIERETQHQ